MNKNRDSDDGEEDDFEEKKIFDIWTNDLFPYLIYFQFAAAILFCGQYFYKLPTLVQYFNFIAAFAGIGCIAKFLILLTCKITGETNKSFTELLVESIVFNLLTSLLFSIFYIIIYFGKIVAIIAFAILASLFAWAMNYGPVGVLAMIIILIIFILLFKK